MKRIQCLSIIVKRMSILATLTTVIFALAGFAHAARISAQHSQKSKQGSLKITAPTDVGGVVLKPGDYEVKEVNSQSGQVIEFTRLFEGDYVPEGLPVWEREVVAQIKCTLQPLGSIPKQTQLLFESNGTKAIGLEIRGSETEYFFQVAGNTGTSSGGTY